MYLNQDTEKNKLHVWLRQTTHAFKSSNMTALYIKKKFNKKLMIDHLKILYEILKNFTSIFPPNLLCMNIDLSFQS